MLTFASFLINLIFIKKIKDFKLFCLTRSSLSFILAKLDCLINLINISHLETILNLTT